MTIVRDLATIAHTGTSHDPAILKQVLLAREDAVASIMQLAQSTLQRGQLVEPHSHVDMWEVFWVQSGVLRCSVDGVDHVLEPGQLIVVAPGQAHGVACVGDEPVVMVVLGVQGEPA